MQQNIFTFLINTLCHYRVSNIKQFNLTDQNLLFEHAIIATTQSSLQMRSIARKISYLLKVDYQLDSKIQGYEKAEWILLATSNIHLHLFLLDLRYKYALDELWSQKEQSINDIY